MAFQNEYLQKLEDEKSAFLRGVRDKLRIGFVMGDQWTVDRNSDAVLVRVGGGHDIDTKDADYWSFMEPDREFRLRTTLVESRELSPGVLHLKRSIRFMAGLGFAEPNADTVQRVKEALAVYKDYGMLSRYASGELLLTTDDGEAI